MSILAIKTQIENSLSEIISSDLSPLFPSGPQAQSWNNTPSIQDYEGMVFHSIKNFKYLKENISKIDDVGYQNAQMISQNLSSFLIQFRMIKTIPEKQISNQHHQALFELDMINNNLRNFGLVNYVNHPHEISKISHDLKNAIPILKKFKFNKKRIEDAISTSEEWIKTKQGIENEILKGQIDAFSDRAHEHKIQGDLITRSIWGLVLYKGRKLTAANYWILATFFFAIVIGYITYNFITQNNLNISAGSAILRITSIVVPSYLMILSTNQYLYHKKMYETYMFKYASLNTMNHLISTKNEPMQEKILEKGLNVLFSEPTFRENNSGSKQDKLLISELISMLKKQM